MACCLSEMIFTVPGDREEMSVSESVPVSVSVSGVLPVLTEVDLEIDGLPFARSLRLYQEPIKNAPPKSTRSKNAYINFFIANLSLPGKSIIGSGKINSPYHFMARSSNSKISGRVGQPEMPHPRAL